MLITNKTPYTTIELWFPRYDKSQNGVRNFLPAVYKVDQARTPYIKVIFTKAKHLENMKFIMKKEDVQKYPKVFNGTIQVYEVPEQDWGIVENDAASKLLKESGWWE